MSRFAFLSGIIEAMNDETPIRVVLADDHPLLLGGLDQLLSLERDIRVVARCPNGNEALAAIARERPHVAVVDLTMPGRSGLDLLRYILEANSLGGDDLAKIIGVDRSVAYRILTGERGLTTDHIKALCKRFGVPADVFIR